MISVCMATYNGEKYLKEQVDSILVQLSADDELIVSDDGSTDETLYILQNYNDSRIRIFHNVKYKGVVGNFENALKNVRGEYVFLSDQDDVWIEGKVAKCIEALKNADIVVTDCIITDDKLNILESSFFQIRGSKKGYMSNLTRNSYIGCCIAFRSSMLSIYLPFPNKIAMHDMFIGLCTERVGKVVFIQEALIKYRRHDCNASLTGGKSDFSWIDQFNYRLRMFVYTIFIRK